jgi:hypothetical protein
MRIIIKSKHKSKRNGYLNNLNKKQKITKIMKIKLLQEIETK